MQFYQFPEYTPDALRAADERAKTLIEASVPVGGVSRQLIRDVFGKELADEIYPQAAGRPLDAADAFADRVAEAVSAQIAADGYTTNHRVLAAVRSVSGAAVAERRLKRALPGVMRRMGLKRQSATSDIKQRFGIRSPGFPRIILKVEPTATDRPFEVGEGT